MTLTEFLEARITEDEASERFVSRRHLGAGYVTEDVTMIEPSARVLAECQAKRRLIADLSNERHLVVEDCWYTCAAATEEREGEETCNDNTRDGPCDCGRDARVMRRLSILATVYADHPDYLPEWKP